MDSIELSSRGETQAQPQPQEQQPQDQTFAPPKTRTTWKTILTTRAIRTTVSTARFVRNWWATNIRPVVTVELGSQTQRDYLSLERTYLSYIRTSNAIVTFAIITIQLFIVRARGGRHYRHSPHSHNKRYTAVTAGKILACISIVVAILTVLAGTRRYFRQQGMLLRRGSFAIRGFDLVVLVGLYAVVSLPFLSFRMDEPARV